MAGRKAQHIHIIIALTVDADDLFLGLALDTGDLLQIQGIFAFVEDRDLGDNGLGELDRSRCLTPWSMASFNWSRSAVRGS